MREVSISLTCQCEIIQRRAKVPSERNGSKKQIPELCTAEIKEIIRYTIVETTKAQKWRNELILLN